jgi:hypothetical protein
LLAPPPQYSVAPIRSSVVVLCETMWSLISPCAKRIRGPEKFLSSPQKDFCNNIGTKRTCRACLTMSTSGEDRTSRLIVQRNGKRVRLFTRNGYDWSDRYPLITEAVLSASTAMPGIGLPVHVPDMFARKARCAQVECKSNDRNRIQKLQKWPGWRCHAEQAGVFRRGVRTPFSG